MSLRTYLDDQSFDAETVRLMVFVLWALRSR
jgi:hypothetical protein